MLATTTLRSPSSSGVGGGGGAAGPALASPSAAGVLRVGREIENIGERVPMSKKRITWRFVFTDSEQVHTVTLEHSRISAKKRLRLDGRRLFTSEQYCPGDWRYEFQVAKTHAARFCVAIKDVKSTVVEERSLDSIYQLFVDGRAWDHLEVRRLASAAKTVWSSEMYARRVVEERRVLTRAGGNSNSSDTNQREGSGAAVTATCVAWTFAFGLHGTIHKLELRDLDRGDDGGGEFAVILDSRLLTRVNHDDIDEDVWEYDYSLFDQHTLSVVVTLEAEGKKYEFFIDGCAWKDLSETDFVLQPGWFPVFSRSRGTSYFRNEATGVSQWDRPIVSRDGVAIDVPRRQSTLSLPPPTDRFDDDGLVRFSTGIDNQVPNSAPSNQHDNNLRHDDHPHPHQTNNTFAATKEDSVNLLDFSEMSVHVSPTAQLQLSMNAFDPFAHIASQQAPASAPIEQPQQPPARGSSQPPPPIDLLS